MKDIKKEKIIENYWLNRLAGELPKITLPLVNDEPAASREVKKSGISMEISAEIVLKLKDMVNNSAVGLFILFLAGLNLLLNKYTGVEDLVIGTVSPKEEGVKEKLLFSRNAVPGNITFKELVLKTRQIVIEAFNYSDYSFGTLYQKLSTANNTNKLDIFNVAMIYDNIQNRGKMLDQFDLILVLSDQEGGNGMVLRVEYQANLYSSGIIRRFSRNFISFFDNLTGKLEQPKSKINITGPEELKELLEFNKTGAPYPEDTTIHELFQQQVDKTPDKLAVVYEDQQMTYRELNKRSNHLADLLRKRGVKEDTIVGIMLERSLDMIVGLLAILKAGGSYLPIDTTTPEERIVSMLEECNVSLLVTSGSIIDNYSLTTLLGIDRTGAAPHVYLTPPAPRITDFDGLGFPDRSLVNQEKYNRYIGQALVKNRIVLQAARGCPHNCAYCYRIWPRKQVARSAENIFQEIQLYYNMGIKKFDIFMLNITQGRKLFQLIIENKMRDIQLFFPNGFRGDLLTKEYIDLMVKAGTVNLALALETASPRLQKLINKHLNLEKFRENVEYICEKYPHLIFELFTMHGIPTESQEEAAMTMEFIKSLKWIHFPYINVLKIYSNTDMEKIALENGISRASILKSENLAWHVWSDTLPFNKEFTAKYQADFLNDYVLSKERLLYVLPYQFNILSEDELVQKYNSYLPTEINCFDDLLECTQISRDELDAAGFRDEKEDEEVLGHLNERIKKHFPSRLPAPNALRVLLLDLSQFFSHRSDILYDVVDPPLGMMYLLTYLHAQLGENINGKVLKSRIDFDSYEELKECLEEFRPEVIGVRTLSYYKDFFHKTLAMIRQWGIEVPIIAGGPYVTVENQTALQDRNIHLAVLGEGERTFCELIKKIMGNNRKLPEEAILREIPGIAFVPGLRQLQENTSRGLILLDGSNGNSSGSSSLSLFSTIPGRARMNPVPGNPAHHIAYVIFTSGSTGKPKGVPIEHRNAVNVLNWFGRAYHLQKDTHVIQLTNYTFDPSVEQIFSTLIHGGVLHVPRRDLAADKNEFRKYIEKKQIQVFNFIPGMLKELLDHEVQLKSLQSVISGGEKLEESVKDRLIAKGYQLYNQYGPTETTIDALVVRCAEAKVTLGQPISNVRCYILGENSNLLPIGVRGELYIAGAGVSRGYLNNPELTAEKFRRNIIGNSSKLSTNDQCPMTNDRLYKTGDFARWLSNGNIEFLGRIDHQVKIMGYRIELEEIESQLLTHKDIKEAVVTAVEPGKIKDHADNQGIKYLCAYFVSKTDIPTPELRDYLLKKLPDYMIPAYFTRIGKMPVTPTGKVDRQALSLPGPTPDRYAAPRNEVEEKLVRIWSEILGIEKEEIGTDSNFFELGGHSLKITVLIFKIHKEFNVKISLIEIFNILTIQELAAYIKGKTEDKFVPIEVVEKREYYDVSHAQKRLWILDRFEKELVAYNVPGVCLLQGKLSIQALNGAIGTLVTRHESLRTTFIRIKEEPKQRIHDSNSNGIMIEYIDLRGKEKANGKAKKIVEKEASLAFNLEKGPLLRTKLLHMDEEKYLFLFTMHHIISDGWSMNVLMREFFTLYNAYRKNKQNPLEPLRIQYKDYSTWHNRQLSGERLKKHRDYWLNQLKGKIPILKLKTDYPRPPVKTYNGNCIDFELNKEISDGLNRLSQKNGVSLFMTLLAVLNVFFYCYTGQEDIIIGSPIAGREHNDLENQIGYYLNTLPLRITFSGDDRFEYLLGRIKEITLNAYENQLYPLNLLVGELQSGRDPSRNPLFDLVMQLLNLKIGSDNQIEMQGVTVAPIRVGESGSQFDLNFHFSEPSEETGTINVNLIYNTDLFKHETVVRMINRFQGLVKDILKNPAVCISDLNFESYSQISAIKPIPRRRETL